jgi:hypothetical protein
MIDIISLYQRYGIPFQKPGHKHVRQGWIGIPCPYCTGNPGYHLGYCIDPVSKYAGHFRCWRCGGKKAIEVIKTITHTDSQGAFQIIKQFSTGSGTVLFESGIRKGPSTGLDICKLPAGTGQMLKRHRDYLMRRDFDPEKIESLWSLQATGPVGEYNHRIIIPIYFNGKLVSYQGRDITGRSKMKYKACRQDLESREHKHCLYGLDQVKGDSVVVVEGVTDVWRLGPGSVAAFGIEYTAVQVALLTKFKKIFILFDEEEQAQEQARKLAGALICPERVVEIVSLSSGDPGDMSQQDADELMEDLLKC